LEQLTSNEPFSTPFEITNTGYLGIHVDYVTAVAPRVEYAQGPTFKDVSTNQVSWDNFDLGRGGSTTILPSLINGGAPSKADVVIAVDYRYLGIKSRWMFRFDGIHRERWQWSKQPIGKREAEFNKEIDYSLGEHLKAIAQSAPQ